VKTIPALAVVVALLGASLAPSQLPAAGAIRDLTIDAPSLSGNLSGVPTRQRIVVYLPPGYDAAPRRRYPVLLLLHGVNDSPSIWTDAWQLPARLDRLVAAGAIEDMIVVMPNGRTTLLGSYYTNSPVTGRWEDFITTDVVGYVDRQFRTIADPAHRGIAGHSMGGFGALRIGMRRPDLFQAVYALSPCCLDFVEGIGYGNQAWLQAAGFRTRADVDAALTRGDTASFYAAAMIALAQVISPNPLRPPLFADLPVRIVNGEVAPNEPTYSQWRDFLPMSDARTHRTALRTLAGLAIDYGVDDQFADIPAAVPEFSRLLAELRVPHVLDVYAGNHTNRVAERLESHVLPYVSKKLAARTAK
jgi:S-formylglutathione hydrolase FrmB